MDRHPPTSVPLRFSNFEMDLRAGELRKGGSKLKLSGQPFQVLAILLEHSGQIVTREELQKQLWPDTFVDVDHSLNTAINKIREVLGDSAENPRFVETLPRRGYRFIAPVIAPMDGDGPKPLSASKIAKRMRIWPILAAVILGITVAAGAWLVKTKRRGGPASTALAQRTLTRVTFDSGLQIGVTWSPDARYIAYSSTRGGKSDVWVQQISGGDAIQITKGAGQNWQPSWSPDGKYLAYRSEGVDGGLFVVPALGGAGMQRRISDFGMYPSWSPDGSQILFLSIGFGVSSKVFVVRLQGGEASEVLPGIGARVQVMSAGWHPDGKRVSIWGWTLEPSPLPAFWTGAVVPGSEPIRTEIAPEILKIGEAVAGTGIGPWADGDFKFAWAPTGQAIYFERSYRGAKNIWRMRVDPQTLRATAIERLTTGSEGESEFALSPDGTKLAFTSANQQVRAWIFPFDSERGRVTGAGESVTSSGLEAWEGSLSLDGQKLAFMAKRAGKWELREKSLVNDVEAPVLAEDLYVRNEPQWSPDGKKLAYVRQNPAKLQQQLVTWDTQARTEKEITPLVSIAPFTNMFLLAFDWSPDGKWLVTSEQNAEGQTDMWIEPAAGRRAEPTTARKIVTAQPNSDIWQGRMSPDGRWVVFELIKNALNGFESSIYVAPVAGGKWIRITDGKHWNDKPRWSPDGRAIYFLSERGGYFHVFGVRFDPAAGKTAGDIFQVTQFHDPSFMVGRLVSTVGLSLTKEKLMVTTYQSSGSIWVLDGVDR